MKLFYTLLALACVVSFTACKDTEKQNTYNEESPAKSEKDKGADFRDGKKNFYLKSGTLACTLEFVEGKVKKQSCEENAMVDLRDYRVYGTVKIGKQIWMAENLNYETASSYCYDESSNCEYYGRHYSWEDAMKACPEGWRLPTIAEFMTLIGVRSEGGYSKASKILKNGSNERGFSAILAGARNVEGMFFGVGSDAFFWSSSEYSSSCAKYMSVSYKYDLATFANYGPKNAGYTVRCLKGVAPKKNFLTDTRDGKEYATVKIGKQVWMAENLNYKTKSSYCYDDEPANCEKYGRLYTWNTAVNVCPKGWHLPTKAEFNTLLDMVGIGESIYESKLILKSNKGNGSNEKGFSALLAGDRSENGYYMGKGNNANFWISTEGRSNLAYCMILGEDGHDAYVDVCHKNNWYSVRCLKD